MAAGVIQKNVTIDGVPNQIALSFYVDNTVTPTKFIPVNTIADKGLANFLAVDTHGSAQTTLVDSSGTAITFNGNQAADYAKSVGAAPVMLPQDQAIIVKATTVTNGTTKTRIVSAATTNATSVKASAGKVMSLRIFNVAAYDVFFKFYDKASAPTVGTDTPTWTIPLKAGTGYSEHFILGDDFTTGIAYAITKLQADSDTTAVAAGDVTGKMHWI